jgi:hypothetical protein
MRILKKVAAIKTFVVINIECELADYLRSFLIHDNFYSGLKVCLCAAQNKLKIDIKIIV